MISAIICTYNRATVLTRSLSTFLSQVDVEPGACELIVVDNNSVDNTPDVVAKFMPRGVQYVIETQQGASHARNAGVASARGDVVAFLDDDILVEPGWLTHLETSLDETSAEAVVGPIELEFESPPPVWLSKVFRQCLGELELGPKRRTLEHEGLALEGNLAIRKAVYERYGGLDGSLGRKGGSLVGGEGPDLMKRIMKGGGTFIYDPNIRVRHLIGPERLTWPYFKRAFVGFGRSAVMLHDPRDGFGPRLRRFLMSVREWIRSDLKVLKACATGHDITSRYARRAAHMRAAGMVAERWKRLMHPGA